RPFPLVARVVGGTALVRSGPAWLAREVAVAAFVAGCGAPALGPSSLLPPGPHAHGGRAITFWPLIETAVAADRAAAAVALRRCHQALEGYRRTLPPLAPLEETGRLLDHPLVRPVLDAGDRALLVRAVDGAAARVAASAPALRPLHGDAHAGNCFAT